MKQSAAIKEAVKQMMDTGVEIVALTDLETVKPGDIDSINGDIETLGRAILNLMTDGFEMDCLVQTAGSEVTGFARYLQSPNTVELYNRMLFERIAWVLEEDIDAYIDEYNYDINNAYPEPDENPLRGKIMNKLYTHSGGVMEAFHNAFEARRMEH